MSWADCHIAWRTSIQVQPREKRSRDLINYGWLAVQTCSCTTGHKSITDNQYRIHDSIPSHELCATRRHEELAHTIASNPELIVMTNRAEPSSPDIASVPPSSDDLTADTAVNMSEIPFPNESNVTPATTCCATGGLHECLPIERLKPIVKIVELHKIGGYRIQS